LRQPWVLVEDLLVELAVAVEELWGQRVGGTAAARVEPEAGAELPFLGARLVGTAHRSSTDAATGHRRASAAACPVDPAAAHSGAEACQRVSGTRRVGATQPDHAFVGSDR
jgi:hypothetical protein